MKLAILNSADSASYWGTTHNPIVRPSSVIIARLPDDSQFLLLVAETVPPLAEQTDIPQGFIFTYRQEWGLTLNWEVVQRVWNDLRASAYPPAADYLDGIVKGDQTQVDRYISDCLAVKARYPKLA
jgi:hypothetical protein